MDGTPNEPRNSRDSFGAGVFDDSAELDRTFHFERLEDVCRRGAQRILWPSCCRAHATTSDLRHRHVGAAFPALRRKHFHGRYSDYGAIEQRTARKYAPMPRPPIPARTRRSTRTLRTSRKVDEPAGSGQLCRGSAAEVCGRVIRRWAMTSAHQPLSGLGSGHTIRSRSSSSAATGASGFSITMTFLCAGARSRTHSCGEPSCSCAAGNQRQSASNRLNVEQRGFLAPFIGRPRCRSDTSTFTTAHLKQTDLFGLRSGHQAVAWVIAAR